MPSQKRGSQGLWPSVGGFTFNWRLSEVQGRVCLTYFLAPAGLSEVLQQPLVVLQRTGVRLFFFIWLTVEGAAALGDRLERSLDAPVAGAAC